MLSFSRSARQLAATFTATVSALAIATVARAQSFVQTQVNAQILGLSNVSFIGDQNVNGTYQAVSGNLTDYQPGSLNIPTAPAGFSEAFNVSSDGTKIISDNGQNAFLTADGITTTLALSVDPNHAISTILVNNAGQIGGTAFNLTTNSYDLYTYNETTGLTFTNNGASLYANTLTNSGQLVGTASSGATNQIFFADASGVSLITNPVDFSLTALNTSASGRYTVAASKSLLTGATGLMEYDRVTASFVTISTPGADSTFGTDGAFASDTGAVVGSMTITGAATSVGFYAAAANGYVAQDLNGLIVNSNGETVTNAYRTNGKDDIAVSTLFGNTYKEDTILHMVSPGTGSAAAADGSTLALLASGMGIIGYGLPRSRRSKDKQADKGTSNSGRRFQLVP